MFESTKEELGKIRRNIIELNLFIDVAIEELNNAEEKALKSTSPSGKRSITASQIADNLEQWATLSGAELMPINTGGLHECCRQLRALP